MSLYQNLKGNVIAPTILLLCETVSTMYEINTFAKMGSLKRGRQFEEGLTEF